MKTTKKYTGMILRDGILHLYESAEDLRAAMVDWGTDWSRIAWLNGVEVHETRKAENAGVVEPQS